MTTTESPLVSVPSAGIGKMDDKKRPAASSSDAQGPPKKKQATDLNGKGKADRDADMPWKDDLERFQKDAIWRQMQEYKREKSTLETRVSEMAKRAAYHDDHLRIIDGWWRQLLDEVKTLTSGIDSADSQENKEPRRLPSTLLFADSELFQEHLSSHSEEIKSTLSQLFARLPQSASSDVTDLQERVNALLAAEKEHEAEVERLRTQRDQLEEELENATTRYRRAEMKLDRTKSQAVAKLEQQGLSSSMKKGEGSAGKAGGDSTKDAPSASNDGGSQADIKAELERAQKEAAAVADKQREQMDQLEAQNENLTEQITALTIKMTNLSDEDYARSELFQHMKCQYEDVIKRVNHLEAMNIHLREEASSLQAERTAYREKIQEEVQAPIGDLEHRLSTAEIHLARIRAARDELAADVAIRKASHERDQATYDQMKELLAAREERITALEAETERLRLQIGSSDQEVPADEDLSAMGLEELIRKYRNLAREYSLINKELPAMGAAWKKASTLASKKVADTTALEEKVRRLQADKSKADQKYFATVRLNEAREVEVKTLRAQNLKSSEIVAQLKEVEMSTQPLVSNLEKQLTETKDALTSLNTQNRNLQQQITQGNIATSGLRNQVHVLTTVLKQKDVELGASSKGQRELEAEAERLRACLAETEKMLDTWKARASGNDTAESDALRALALCGVCNSRFKDTTLKTCGHLFCRPCIDERMASRSRRCPHCGRAFGVADVMAVHM